MNTLSETRLRQIADTARIQKIAPKTQLLASKEHRWLLYLLNGKMMLKPAQGAQSKLSSNNPAATTPLFESGKKLVPATALTASLVIRIDKNQLNVLLEQEQTASTVVGEFDINEAGEALFSRVYQNYVDRKLRLPSLSGAALKIRETV